MSAPQRISLALQGGGAHGAFTWGVLDRLLDAPEIEIAALSGTSAGALNAAAYKAGLLSGGREGARAALEALWDAVSQAGDWRMSNWFFPLLPMFTAASQAAEDMLPVSPQGMAAQLISPYDWGPLWRNPLAPAVETFDFSKVCAHAGPRLFISATNVRSGKIRVFGGEEITPQVLLASACLPSVFQAVELDDPKTGQREAFWDGGYTGNPALFPLYERDLPDDIVVVAINPMQRADIPKTPGDIQDRVSEISFNASLLSELRAIDFVQRLIREGRMPKGVMKALRVHMIGDEALMAGLNPRSKMSPTPEFVAKMKAAGQAAASLFLAQHSADIGTRASTDLRALFG